MKNTIKNAKKLSKSSRKHIRIEKARIRREFFDMKIQKEKIAKLYEPDKPVEVKKKKPTATKTENKGETKPKEKAEKKPTPKIEKKPSPKTEDKEKTKKLVSKSKD